MKAYETAVSLLQTEPKVWAVTGVAGFIGSNLLEKLLRLNQRVVGLDNFSTGSRRNLQEVMQLVGPARWKNFRFIEGDVRSLKSCRRAMSGADYVLHQAALGSIPRSLARPADCHASNVTGMLNSLVAARDQGVKRFVFASSSSIYGDNQDLPRVEGKVGRCLSPYAATKLAGELYAGVFSRCYGLETVCLRYFNVFGPRQDPDGPYAAVIPKWLASMIRNEPVCINGDGETSRDFCYVANVVQANILAAIAEDPKAVNETYNVATCSRTTLNQLFELLVSKLLPRYPHLKGYAPVFQPFRAGDVRHSEADISKGTRLLGYCPSHDLERGLSEALDWYVDHLSTPSETNSGTGSLQRALPTQRPVSAESKRH